jgi:hypothetical protein
MNGHGLGLRVVERKSTNRPMLAVGAFVGNVNRKLDLYNPYIPKYDQGREGACVGYGYSWMMSILNRRFYDARWLYQEAQKIDQWAETPPEEGTSAEAGANILLVKGHRRIWGGSSMIPRTSEGIAAVVWANPHNVVDEVRTKISEGVPAGMAINWYQNFDRPVWSEERGWVIGEGDLGRVRGGHFVCIYGARDKYDCVDIVNNWGLDYPLVKMPYSTVERLAMEAGDFPLILDR